MEIIQFIRAILRRWWVLVICGVAGLVVAYSVSTAAPKRYESTVTLQLNSSARGGLLPFMGAAGGGAATGLAASYTEVLRSRSFAQVVIGQLNLSVAPEEISRAISARLIPSTDILRLTVSWDNPQDAQGLAEAVAELFISENLRRQQNQPGAESQLSQMEQIVRAYPARLEALRQQRDRLDQAVSRGDMSRLSELGSLDARLASMDSAYATLLVSIEQARRQLDTASILDSANPAQAVGPLGLERALPIGLFAGVAAAILLAMFLESLDDTIRSPADLADAVESGPLGVIGRVRSSGWRGEWRRSGLVTLHAAGSGPAEAFRTLRANLRFLATEGPLRTLVVTSGSANEGKTLVASNMAIAFAQAGDRVLLVDADLRRPSIHDSFGINSTPGLSELLMQREPEAARSRVAAAAAGGGIRPVSAREGVDEGLSLTGGRTPLLGPVPEVVSSGIDNLWILPAGSAVRDPTRLLDSRGFSSLIEDLGKGWDVVIFDTAPVGPVADTLAVAARSDATLLVARSDRTRRNVMETTIDALRKTGRPVLGVIFNDYSPDVFSRYTPYSSYYHSYGYTAHGSTSGDGRNGHSIHDG